MEKPNKFDVDVRDFMKRMKDIAENGAKEEGVTPEEYISLSLSNGTIGPHCPECGIFSW